MLIAKVTKIGEMGIQNLICLCGLFFGLFGLSSGLYFHIAETERKCFIEEIPDERMVTGEPVLLESFISSQDFLLSLKSSWASLNVEQLRKERDSYVLAH